MVQGLGFRVQRDDSGEDGAAPELLPEALFGGMPT